MTKCARTRENTRAHAKKNTHEAASDRPSRSAALPRGKYKNALKKCALVVRSTPITSF